jgi:hypothetical protein
MNLSRTRRQCLSLWRWQAFLGVYLVLGFLGDVWHAGHLLLVHHIACPHDGALVHEDDLPAEARTLARSGSAVATDHTAIAQRHEHDDCSRFSAIQRHAAILPTNRDPAEPTTQEPSEPSVASGREVQRDVLTYAPRLPPPVWYYFETPMFDMNRGA